MSGLDVGPKLFPKVKVVFMDAHGALAKTPYDIFGINCNFNIPIGVLGKPA